MSEWKPGDVAMVTIPGRPEQMMVRYNTGSERGWYQGWGWNAEGKAHYSDECGAEHATARRLVVIDPTDREQVERLADAYLVANPNVASMPVVIADRLQAALREFADPKPPKPDEPMGLGAVVEDSEGDIWLRDGMPGDRSQSGHWWNKTVAHEKNYDGVLRADWHAIAAVRVLSPGVTDGGAS